MKVVILAMLLFVGATGAARAEDMQGWASATDGDTLRFYVVIPMSMAGMQRVRLRNFNAPELNDAGGREAKEALQSLVEGYPVTCRPVSRDKYARIVAVCSTPAGDLAEGLKALGIGQKRRKT